MTTISVEIPYLVSTFHETVKADLVDGDVWELREHTGFAALAPGDRVRVDETNRLAEIVSLEPTYVHTVFCHLPAGITFGMEPTPEHPAMKAMAEIEEEWRRDTWVTRTTGFTFVVSSPSLQWFADKVQGHPYVEDTELIRTPATSLDLPTLLAHPHFGEMELVPMPGLNECPHCHFRFEDAEALRAHLEEGSGCPEES